jgi:predicted component of type VI protein secretion system
MSVLRTLESKIAGLVEGTFSRAFRSREMDEHKTVSVSRTYAPNEYCVYLSSEDRAQLEGFEEELRSELAGHLLEHARRERLELLTQPVVEFETDDRLRLGEFGIQTRLVRSSEPDREPRQAERGHTMIYSTAERVAGPVEEAARPYRGTPLLMVGGKRVVVGPSGATIGRSRECDVVLADANVSRRHAELRPSGGAWVVEDLGSTNGVKVNGRRITAASALNAGDTIELGTSALTFELE